jgi:16S rRNA (uracil1498-N3)-methyltransferase
MARRRFFVDAIRGGAATITGEDAAHLTRVLRVETGERFEISDSENVWLAEVTEARKSLVGFRIIEEIPPGPLLPIVHLYAAIFKFDRFEWMVEKLTELGVTRLIPVETQRTDHGLFAAAEKRVGRWRRIAREASQQSRRTRLPDIEDAIKFAKVDAAGFRIVLDELPGTEGLVIPSEWRADVPLSLFIGPEGGWTDEERAKLKQAGWVAGSLGPTILRAETAGIAAMALVMHGAAGRPQLSDRN